MRERERERKTSCNCNNQQKESGKKTRENLGKSGEESAYNNNAHKSINKCLPLLYTQSKIPNSFFLSLSHTTFFLILFIYLFILFIYIYFINFLLMIKVLNTSVLS
jgi:hypothetical protein